MAKRLTLLIGSFLLVCFYTVWNGDDVFSQTSTPSATSTQTSNPVSDERLKELQNQIKDFEQKITELQGQQKTLASQIKIMDSQIKITQLRIDETRQRIDDLLGDIAITRKKIISLEKDINSSTKLLLERISAVYEVGRVGAWEIFLTSGNISNALTRLKYLKIVQMYDKRHIYATEQARVNYANEKTVLEIKQREEESLRKKLENYTLELESERRNKENLLAVTKNSEKEYQRRLVDALLELQQIQKAAKVLISTEPRHVDRGEIIGIMGNTGYSFGAHLHFGVYDISSLDQYNYYSSYENPSNVLEGKSVDWQTECGGDPVGQSNTGSGSFMWPMETGDLHITQGFGHTCYSDVYYRGNPHPALDMYNNANTTVKASEEGMAYVCRNCTGDGANGVFLFHKNGKMSLYWHLR